MGISKMQIRNFGKQLKSLKVNFKKWNVSSFRFFSSGIHNKRDHEDLKSKDQETKWVSSKAKDYSITPKEKYLQFSKAPISDNFGELKPGEIPEPLKYVRPFEMTTLENGIRVCTEYWDSPLAAVGVFIDAGSRYETQDTSGSAHFLEHILFKGTKNRTKTEFESEIENIGATLDAYTSREHTLFHMQCLPNSVDKCVNILGDMMQNPLLSAKSVEEEKDTIKTELEESSKDVQEIIMEGIHFNSFRDHQMGQPILGDIDNIYNVTQDMVREYHSAHYVGTNMVIVGTGNIKHSDLVDLVNKEFSNVNKNPPPGLDKKNLDKCIYTPSCMFMRDDELYNTGVGVFFDAPSWYHEDYYAFLLLERIIGEYSMDKNGYANLNNPHKQYSMFQGYLGSLPDVQRGQAVYSPYKDCGLFGTYMYGNEVFTRQMAYTGLFVPASYGNYMNQVEVYRGRAKIWQELLGIQSPAEVLQLIGPQVLYLNRRVHRSEIAKRVSYFDAKNLENVCKEWLLDAEPSIVAYGACEGLAGVSSYRYFKINTYVTNLNLNHSLA